METLNDFIEMIRAKYPETRKNNAALAKVLGVSRQAVHQYFSGYGRSKINNDVVGYNIAEALGLDPAYVIPCLTAERSNDDRIRITFQRISTLFKNAGARAAIIAVLLVSIFVPTKPASANVISSFHITQQTTHYARRKVKYWLAYLVSRLRLSFTV